MLTTILLWLFGGFLALFLLLLGYFAYRYWQHMGQLPKAPFRPLRHKPAPVDWSDSAVTFTWIGHSTILMNLYGTKILTDPVLGEKVGIKIAGPLHFGPKRYTPPSLTHEELADVDVILLSHAHMDHLDLPSLRKLARKSIQVITAKNTGRLVRRLPFGSVEEIGVGESKQTRHGVRITAIPVRHWGNRFPWNSDYGYNGYILEKGDTRILFPGDTAYTPMEGLRKFGPIDVAFMPIGAYKPDSYQRAHCTPEQAWQMFIECGAKWLVPIHWNSFVLSQEAVDEPLQRLLAAAGEERHRIVIEEQGQTYSL